jgi:hypothetical protein
MVRAEVAELVDALGSGSSGGFPVRVRVSPSAPQLSSIYHNSLHKSPKILTLTEYILKKAKKYSLHGEAVRFLFNFFPAWLTFWLTLSKNSSVRSIASEKSDSSTWSNLKSISPLILWPNITALTFLSIPALRISVLAVCLKSWNVKPSFTFRA